MIEALFTPRLVTPPCYILHVPFSVPPDSKLSIVIRSMPCDSLAEQPIRFLDLLRHCPRHSHLSLIVFPMSSLHGCCMLSSFHVSLGCSFPRPRMHAICCLPLTSQESHQWAVAEGFLEQFPRPPSTENDRDVLCGIPLIAAHFNLAGHSFLSDRCLIG